MINFYRIQTHNLKNTELIGKQDPYVKIIDSDGNEIGKTFTLFDKGGSVLFDWLDIKTSTEKHHLYSKDDIEEKRGQSKLGMRTLASILSSVRGWCASKISRGLMGER